MHLIYVWLAVAELYIILHSPSFRTSAFLAAFRPTLNIPPPATTLTELLTIQLIIAPKRSIPTSLLKVRTICVSSKSLVGPADAKPDRVPRHAAATIQIARRQGSDKTQSVSRVRFCRLRVSVACTNKPERLVSTRWDFSVVLETSNVGKTTRFPNSGSCQRRKRWGRQRKSSVWGNMHTSVGWDLRSIVSDLGLYFWKNVRCFRARSALIIWVCFFLPSGFSTTM